RDITDRKQAEEKLAASEAELRALFASMQDVVLIIDKDGVYRKIAPTNPSLLYNPPQELLGKSLAEVFPQAEADHFLSATREVLATGQSKQIEYQLRIGEALYWFLTNITPMSEELTVWVAHDITNRKRTEDEIRLLKEFDENLINNMSEGIAVQNAEGIYTYLNPAVTPIIGYLPEELVGEHWTKFFSADQQKIIKEADNQRRAGKASQYEIDFLHKSGKRINLLVSGSPLFENERFNGTMAVFTDITERKQAEEKIRLQLERLTALREIDQVITSTFDIRLSLNALVLHTARLLKVDAVTVLLLNSATNTLEYGAGLGFWTDAPKTASVKLGESYAGRAATEGRIVNIPNLADEPHNLLLTGFLKGENFVSYYGAPLIVKGKVIGVLEAFNRSVVERDTEWLDFFNTLAGQAAIAIDNANLFEDLQHKNIELEMRVEERTAELIRANRAKDEFLAGMSHELRTPLNGILSLSESLEGGTYGKLEPHQVEILHIIAESGKHLLELINDILDLSKIEAGKLELQASPMAVEAFCQASMRMIKQTAFQKRLQISVSNTSNIEVIHADERRLKQMLVNLLSNAVKFTPEGGQ
ncbi:MAG: PAS domain S-box protein, partial [Anaerolineales bacterium]|nr:PAS domain S-box protein [Anaerolineales bacterium]